MKYSRQRELIQNFVLQNPVHPTADYVYTHLKKEQPALSLATVYRNLNLLAENGLIRRIPMPDAKDRYDGCLKKHYHAICDRCGKVYDIELAEVGEIDKTIAEKIGFKAVSHELIVHGVCRNCCEK